MPNMKTVSVFGVL